MSCLRSFTLALNGNVIPSGSNVEIWGPGFNFLARTVVPGSGFKIEGFKNIDVYKIEAVGRVECLFGSNNGLVEDWGLFCQLTGQSAIIGGSLTTPNNLGMSLQTLSPQFLLSKYNPSICFSSPISSATLFSVNQINAQGIHSESPTAVQIGWNFDIVIHYKFEGE
jgi:hypothetical protein